MRVLANFSKKVSTGDYENETYTVSVECETEFNEVPKVADYLFLEARDAVSRQIENGNGNNGNHGGNGKVSSTLSLPASLKSNSGNGNGKKDAWKSPAKTSSKSYGNGNGNGKNPDAKMTDAQRRYLFRLLAERGLENDKAHDTLKEVFKVGNLKDVPKEYASAFIDQLVNENGGNGNG